MEENERILVRRLARQGDAEAFSAIMGQYTGMVYNTCRRVLGNDSQAADAVQETFFQLLKSADRITGSLGSWLHRVATRRAVDLIRQNESRRRREEAFAADFFQEAETWEDLQPRVDLALEELPDDLREVLVLHYLNGRSMTWIGAELRLSQPTISRRVAAALEQLRQKLRAREGLIGSTTLGAFLSHGAQAVPESLSLALGKIALTQAVSLGAGHALATASPWAFWGVKTALASVALALAAGALWVALPRSIPQGRPSPAPALLAKPAPTVAATEAPAPASAAAAGLSDLTIPSVNPETDPRNSSNSSPLVAAASPIAAPNSPVSGSGWTYTWSNQYRWQTAGYRGAGAGGGGASFGGRGGSYVGGQAGFGGGVTGGGGYRGAQAGGGGGGGFAASGGGSGNTGGGWVAPSSPSAIRMSGGGGGGGGFAAGGSGSSGTGSGWVAPSPQSAVRSSGGGGGAAGAGGGGWSRVGPGTTVASPGGVTARTGLRAAQSNLSHSALAYTNLGLSVTQGVSAPDLHPPASSGGR